MLDNVKKMILEKQEYIEASKIIFEDTVENNLDDLIVLSEDGLKDTVLSTFSSNKSSEEDILNKHYGSYIRGIQKELFSTFNEVIKGEEFKTLSENKDLVKEVLKFGEKNFYVSNERIGIFSGSQTYDEGPEANNIIAKALAKTAKKFMSEHTESKKIFTLTTTGWSDSVDHIPGIELILNTPKKISLNINGESKSFTVQYEGKKYEKLGSSILGLNLLAEKESVDIKTDVDAIIVKPGNVLQFGEEEIQINKVLNPSIISKIMKRVFGESFEPSDDSLENYNEIAVETAMGIGAATIALGYGIYRFWNWRKHKAQIRQIFSELTGAPVSDVSAYRKAAQREMSTYFAGKLPEIAQHAYAYDKPYGAKLDIEFTTSLADQRNYITNDNETPMDYDSVNSNNLTFVDFHGLSTIMIIAKLELPYFQKLNSESAIKLGLWEYNNLAPTEGNYFVWSFMKRVGLVTVTPSDLRTEVNYTPAINGGYVINTQGARGNDALMKQMMEELAEVKKNYIICCPMPMMLVKDFMQQYGDSIVTEGFDVSIFDSDDSIFEASHNIGSKTPVNQFNFNEADEPEEAPSTDDVSEDAETPEENDDSDDIMSTDISDDSENDNDDVEDDVEPESSEDDILDAPIDDGSSDDFDNINLVGRQTGEPIELSDDDILSVTIDLKSNTVTDVLPVPPDNAGEAISDDVLSTRVDSGFEDDSSYKGESTSFLEGISLSGGDDAANDSADEPAVDDNSPADENEVTSAVKDKVAEAEPDDEPIDDGSGEDMGGSSSAKEELMKKLSSITKSLEDAKNAVLKSM